MQKKTNDLPAEVRLVVPFAEWVDKHPKMVKFILFVEFLAVIGTALCYNFTTK